MAYQRAIVIAICAVFTGYGLLSAQTVTLAPELSQVPMNITNIIPPAFIMGVDNSGSMSSDETLFRTSDGLGYFSNGSFFDSNGNLRSTGTEISKHISQSGTYRDAYAALRNPEYNRAYFNPATQYTPWKNYTANGEVVQDAHAPIDAAPNDPRSPGSGTRDFTTYLVSRETWAAGSVMPSGTTYYNDNTCNREPGSNVTKNAWVTLVQDKTFSQNCQTQFRYYPARIYLNLSATPPPGFNVSKRVLVKGVGPSSVDNGQMYRYDLIKPNFTSDTAYNAVIQNFADWWTYYGNRNRAMIAGMTNAMTSVEDMRVGYFQINPAGETIAERSNVVMYDMSNNAEKNTLYGLMRALNANGTTPTRSATAFMVKQFTRTDAGAPIKLQCQKNAGMLFTDGFTNETTNALYGLTIGDQDGTAQAPYVAGAPYTGGVASSNTIADIAMYGYKTNLRPDLPAGKVPVPKVCSSGAVPNGADCNPNPHMNFYGVTLGASGKVYEVNAAATADPYAHPPYWEATGTTNLNAANVDDIWHASLNSRGEFINASTPSDITAAMRRILSAVNDGTSPAGTLGVKGARIGTGSMTVAPAYTSDNNGTDWYGELTAEIPTVNASTGAVDYAHAWNASTRLASQGPNARTIKFGRSSGAGNQPSVLDFTANNLSAADLCAEPADPLSRCTGAQLLALTSVENAVAYLRGDKTREGTLRTRSSILGDIVNSSPVLSIPSDDYGYSSLPGAAGSQYEAYLNAKKDAGRPLVFVGANDGMFHVFDGRASSPGGSELYAYIPATSLGHMGNLLFPYVAADQANQKFQHRYFVDGPITVSDVYLDGAWKTIAVGTSGAGGRSVFALDVTGVVKGTGAAINVLWEVNDLGSDTAVASNMGYVLGKPVIVPVMSAGGAASWKVIFGNGYNSANQQARLFVVDAGTGSVSTILASEASTTAYNGLGNVVAIDRKVVAGASTTTGSDGYVDTVYAADQRGAVWKFDLINNRLSLNDPLFIAKDGSGKRQPIMGGLTAAAGPSGGVMVYFGTGSFSFKDDPVSEDTQSVYGVLDLNTSIAGRSQLTEQTVGSDSTTPDGNRYRTTSSNALDAGKLGWYMDLPAGERFVGYPNIANGVVFFPTYQPAASRTADCTTNGNNWLYGLDAVSGAAALSSARFGSPTGTKPGEGTGAVSLVTGGTAPVKDVAVLATPRPSPLSTVPSCEPGSPGCMVDPPPSGCFVLVQVSGADPIYLPRACGRQSWRQIR